MARKVAESELSRLKLLGTNCMKSRVYVVYWSLLHKKSCALKTSAPEEEKLKVDFVTKAFENRKERGSVKEHSLV